MLIISIAVLIDRKIAVLISILDRTGTRLPLILPDLRSARTYMNRCCDWLLIKIEDNKAIGM